MTWYAPNLPQDKHCFFGRNNGVSIGKYASLNANFKSRDSFENIQKNCTIITKHFGLEYKHLLRLKQGISNKCVYITQASQNEIEADGAVTKEPNILLSIGTADCAPVLFADYKNGVIGAAHAGWRGAYSGIIENTVQMMLDVGAEKEHIAAAIGPCIQQKSFEVGEDVYNQFLAQNKHNQKYFKASIRENHYLLDLSGYIEGKLNNLGISNRVTCKEDTYTNEEQYYSYRRDTHQGKIEFPSDFPVELSTIRL